VEPVKKSFGYHLGLWGVRIGLAVAAIAVAATFMLGAAWGLAFIFGGAAP